MNKEKAIQIIDSDFKIGCSYCMHPSEVGWCDNKCQSKKAINMAIEALKMQNSCIICPRCGREFSEYEGRKQTDDK